MGLVISSTYKNGETPEHIPPRHCQPTFDPNLGFNAPRKERVSKLTQQEMRAVNLEKKKRDYCAHLLVDHKMCMKKYLPLFGLCNPELQAYYHCVQEDVVMRMKEYEREKRLKIRQMKKEGRFIEQ